ncbi:MULTISPECIES: hypothetical protein [unclassified Paraburkholderia]|uniref:hypothetical protein n=1 Tax=unclassified Paraburkholderia TaxID=2615204 RepID=UPI002AB1FA57|nr:MULTISPECIES: hypothetical protein [unclassified Paraburkholderia]
MQVTTSTSGAAAATPATPNATVSAATVKKDKETGTTPESSTKVTLSDEGLQKSAQASADDASSSGGVTDSTSAADSPSSLKSVTYGVLGLPDPSKPKPNNTAFGIGKAIAAVGTVVSIITLALKFL